MATGGNELETDAVPFKTSHIDICQFEDHKHFMSSKLKRDNFEILIISHEDDHKYVKEFQRLLMNNVVYNVGKQKVNPKVELHRELIYEDESPTPELDFSLSKALVVFIFATQSFSKDDWSVFEARVSLDKVFNKKNKHKLSLYVVHTEPKECRDYKLPLTLGSVRDLYFSRNELENEKFYTSVKAILESKVDIQIKKDRELFKERRQFFSENQPDVLELYNLNNERSHKGLTQINKQRKANGHCIREKSKYSVKNTSSTPDFMVPVDPNSDTQVDAAQGEANYLDDANFGLNVLNISECGSPVGSDTETVNETTCLTLAPRPSPGAPDEARFLSVVKQSTSGTFAVPEEGGDISADSGAIPGFPEENAATKTEIDRTLLDSGYEDAL